MWCANKRQAMLDNGIDPYPVTLPITSTIKQVRQKSGRLAAGEETEDIVGIAGRVIFFTQHWQTMFRNFTRRRRQ